MPSGLFKIEEDKACLHADGNDPTEGQIHYAGDRVGRISRAVSLNIRQGMGTNAQQKGSALDRRKEGPSTC